MHVDSLTITSDQDYGKGIDKLGDALNFVAKELAKVGSDLGQEAAFIINLDRHQRPLRVRILALGTYCSVPLSAGEITKAALRDNADSVLLIHNHPAGNLSPSQEDIDQTRKILNALGTCEVRLVDHVIMCNDTVYNCKAYSFRQQAVVDLPIYAINSENKYIKPNTEFPNVKNNIKKGGNR